jgi:outer membrane protein insertion porin family
VPIPRALACCLLLFAALPALAQDEGAPLFLVNDSTMVRELSFEFTGTGTFSEGELKTGALLATREPTFLERLAERLSFLPFVSGTEIPLIPIEVQKDVARLRDFYARRGFPQATIDYGGSQLDTASNTIHVVFDVTEGPPLVVRSLRYQVPEGETIAELFETDFSGVRGAGRWGDFRDELPTQEGKRFNTFEFGLTKGSVLDFLRDRGFAFASLQADSTLYPDRQRIDLLLTVQPGPRARVDTVQIVGNESIADRFARREVPLQTGDWFSRRELIDGQRNLFALPLFRVAVGLVPDQPEDSTVTVRYEVREADLRLFRAQTGYSREEGIILQPSIEHRNFLGGARSLNLAAEWRTTLLASPSGGFEAVRRFDVRASLTQPYLFRRDLSGIVAPFYRFEDNDNLGIGYREVGLNTTVLWEIMPFRNANARYTFARAFPLSLRDAVAREAFRRSILGANATLGKVDDFFQPTQGTLYRPAFEYASSLIGSEVEYLKTELDVSHYRIFTDWAEGGVRLYGGYIHPFGQSSDQDDPVTEYRFDLVRFYAGGSSDVRGWGLQQLGPKLIVADTVAIATGPTSASDPNQRTEIENEQYEAVGGTTKLAANFEVRTPFPGLGESWRAAFFVDGAYLNAGEGSRGGLFDAQQLRVGTGAGIRYDTPIGFLRLDLGFKVNPAESDLLTAEELYAKRFLGQDPGVSPFAKFRRRLALHLSIGQAF